MGGMFAHRTQFGYVMMRPFALVYEQAMFDAFAAHPGQVVIGAWDCSAYCINLARMVGMKDPSGNRYSGWGDSAEIRANNPSFTDPSRALPMAFCSWTHGVGHVAPVFRADRTNPTFMNHGGAGLNEVSYEDLNAAFGGERGLFSAVAHL
jgi:hypothetical protein